MSWLEKVLMIAASTAARIGIEDGGIDRKPRDAEVRGCAVYRGSIDHDGFQRPQQRQTRKFRSWGGRACGVLASYISTVGTAESTDEDVQDRRPPPHRQVREPADDGAAGALGTVPVAEVVRRLSRNILRVHATR